MLKVKELQTKGQRTELVLIWSMTLNNKHCHSQT